MSLTAAVRVSLMWYFWPLLRWDHFSISKSNAHFDATLFTFLNSVSVSGNSNSFIKPVTCYICRSTKSVARSLVVWPILECSIAWKQLSVVMLLQQGMTSTSTSCFRKWSTFPCKTLDHSGHKWMNVFSALKHVGDSKNLFCLTIINMFRPKRVYISDM